MDEERGMLDRGDGVRLAWARTAGKGPGVVFLGGFASDMGGTKASHLAGWCAGRGQAFLRFDYSGHGASDGRFADGTIGRWSADALAAIDALTEGPLVLVGSSMGAWIALASALARPARIAALIGLAAAPDFTEALIWPALSFSQRTALMERGMIELPSDYGPPIPLTRALIEDGRGHLLLESRIALTVPVRLIHGQMDADVPWEMALRLAEQLESADVQTILVKDGDHRLSRPGDLTLLDRVLASLLGQDGGKT